MLDVMKPSMRRKHERLKMFHLIFASVVGLACAANLPQVLDKSPEGKIRNNTHESRGVFSPRMNYDQWKPLGRGDPLQNDPTYDYVPPVLDRVHYWMEPHINKKSDPPPNEGKKSEILVLGVSSKKPSSTQSADSRKDPYESFLKFIDGPKFYHHHHNSFSRPSGGHRPSHPMSHTYHPQYYKNKYEKQDEQRMPYTVLVPPPIPPPHMEMPLFNSQTPLPKIVQPSTQRPVYKATTTSPLRTSVSVQEANLVYHSSNSNSNSNSNQWHNNQYSSLASSSQYVTWRTPTEYQEPVTKGNPIVFTQSDTESYKPTEAPKPIMFPTESGHIVFEHHSIYDSPADPVLPTAIYSDLVVAQTPLVLAPTGNPNLHMLHVSGTQPAVTHMSVGSQPMHKGQVSDDTIGNAYVNIGKPNAHIQKEITTSKYPETTIRNTNSIGTSMIEPMMQMPLLPHVYTNSQINSVYTPAIINNGIPFGRRPGPITEDITLQTMQTMQPPPVTTTTEKALAANKKPGFLQSILQAESSTAAVTTPTTTTSTTSTTTVASLTTDPLFKHYKQPMEPLIGPSYLIIQGHSKVKNYGAGHKKTLSGISMPETNEIPQSGEKFSAKHLQSKKDNFKKEETNHRSKGARSLKSLDNFPKDIRETELVAKYEIGVEEGITSTEKYYKGIVESEELGDRTNHTSNRQKRQIEDFIPVVEDAVETYVYDYLKRTSEGSGVGAALASAITSDSADEYVDGIAAPLEDDDEDDEDEE